MKIKKDGRNTRVQVQLSCWNSLSEVDVWINSDYGQIQYLPEAKVNFCSFGSISPGDARLYAEAILKACYIADEINSKAANEHSR